MVTSQNAFHYLQSPSNGGVHTPISYIYANSVDRLAATFTDYDLNKFALESDTGNIYILSQVSPPVWRLVLSGTAGGGQINGISAGSSSVTDGNVVFSNSNGLTFGMSGSTITGSYTVPSTAGLISAFNISAGTLSNNLSNLVFSNSNGVSFGLSGSTITASAVGGGGAGILAAAGTQTATSGTVVFSNSNGLTFGMSNNSIITASYTVPTQSSLSFSNANGVTFGIAGSTLTASVNPSGGGGSINISAGTTSGNLTNFVLSNSNNVSFGLNGSTITGSASFPSQTNYVFSNSNGISFGTNASTVTASYTVPSTAGLISRINVSAGTTSNNLTNFVFSNSNGISFGLNGSTVTGSYTVPTQTSVSYSNANNVTFGLAGSTVTASASFPSQTAQTQSNIQGISAGTTIAQTGNIVFSNSNGVSFGLNGNTITATVNPGAAAGIAAIQAGTQTATSGTFSFVDSNGISFGLNGSSRLTASYTVPSTAGLISNINISAGTTSNNLTAFTLSNSNGLSFGLNGSVLTGSYTVPTQTSISYSNANNVSFGLAGSTITASASFPAQTNFIFSNSNGISFGTNGSTVTASYTVPTQTSLSYSNANGITFGIAGSTLTASYTVPATTNFLSRVNVSAGTASNDLTNFVFSNSNGVSFGLSNSSITGSFSTLVFSNSNGVSFGINAGTLTATVNPGAAAGIAAIQAGTQTQTSGTLVFANSNGLTFGLSGSSQITASVAGTTNTVNFAGNTVFNSSGTIAPGIINFSVGGGNLRAGYFGNSILISGQNLTVSAGTFSNSNVSNLLFSDGGGISWGLNAGTITATVVAGGGTASLYALGNTTQNSSTSLDVRSLSFNGLGAMTVGYSNGSIQLSAPQASTLNNSNNIAFGSAGGSITASAFVNVSAGTTSGNVSNWVYSNSNGVSFGLSGSTITASVPSVTLGHFGNIVVNGQSYANQQNGNSSIYFWPIDLINNYSFTACNLNISNSFGIVNSTMAATLSVGIGIYTRNGTSISLMSSGSFSTNMTNSSTNNTGIYVGVKQFAVPINAFLTPGNYYIGLISKTTFANTNVLGMSNLLIGSGQAQFSGQLGSVNNVSYQIVQGLGVYSAQSSTLPTTVAFSQLNGTNGSQQVIPAYDFRSF